MKHIAPLLFALLLACAPRSAVDVLPVPPLPAMNPFGGMR